jgi:hypothetical protein
MRNMSDRERLVLIKSTEVSSGDCGGVCSGVNASPNRSSRGVRSINARMRSLSWQMASSKCLGHE